MTQSETLHNNGTTVFISDTVRFGQDALLLAAFMQVKRRQRVLDLGSGCGIIPLRLYDLGFEGECSALELNEDACGLIRRSAEHNGLASLKVVCGDLREYCEGRGFDAVSCNPPYFKLGTGAQSVRSDERAARHETECTIYDVARAAARNLKTGGRLCVCWRPERLSELFAALKDNSLEPKRLQMVKNRADGKPWLVLCDARFHVSVGLTVEPDIVTNDGAKVGF